MPDKKNDTEPTTETRLDKRLKRYELEEKKKYVEEWRTQELETAQQRVEVDKLHALIRVLESQVIDTKTTILGSEPKYMQTLDRVERDKIKDKIFEIVNRF